MSKSPRAAAVGGMLALVLACTGACAAERISIGAWEPRATTTPDAALEDDTGLASDLDASTAAALATTYIEAESAQLTAGFSVGADPAASDGHYLSPPAGMPLDTEPGPARASYALNIVDAGSYVIWGRIYAPGASNNRFWFRVDDGPWYKWRISVGEIWFWDAFHDDTDYGVALKLALTAGAHTLTLANCVEGVRLDRLYVTADGDMPKGNDTPCHPPNSIEIDGACQPSCGSQRGNACDPRVCQGLPLIQAYDCTVCCHIEP